MQYDEGALNTALRYLCLRGKEHQQDAFRNPRFSSSDQININDHPNRLIPRTIHFSSRLGLTGVTGQIWSLAYLA